MDKALAQRFGRIGLVRPGLIALVVALAAILSVTNTVSAQGEGEGARELFRETVEPFELALSVEPAEVVAGFIHLSVTVLVAGESTPVVGAVVNIVGTASDGSALQSRAVSEPSRPGIYDANLSMEPGGLWTVTVEVSKDGLGTATHEVSLTVGNLPLSAGLVGTLLWFLTTAALLGGGIYLWRRSRTALSGR
jgi:hypothetical protein